MVPVNAVSSTAATTAGETVNVIPYRSWATSSDTTTAGRLPSSVTVYQASAVMVRGTGRACRKS